MNECLWCGKSNPLGSRHCHECATELERLTQFAPRRRCRCGASMSSIGINNLWLTLFHPDARLLPVYLSDLPLLCLSPESDSPGMAGCFLGCGSGTVSSLRAPVFRWPRENVEGTSQILGADRHLRSRRRNSGLDIGLCHDRFPRETPENGGHRCGKGLDFRAAVTSSAGDEPLAARATLWQHSESVGKKKFHCAADCASA